MNDQQVKAFIGTVDAGSISAAARRLFITPQALQHQLNSLEAELGVKLLNRSRSGCLPTGAGKEFLAWTRQTAQAYESALVRIEQADRKESSVITSLSTGLVSDPLFEDVLVEFAAMHPEVTLNLGFAQSVGDEPCDVIGNDILFDPNAFVEVNHVDTCCFLVMNPRCELVDLAKSKGVLDVEDLVGYTVLVPKEHLAFDPDPKPVVRLRNGIENVETRLYSCFNNAQHNDCTLITGRRVQLSYGPRLLRGRTYVQVPLANSAFPCRLLVTRNPRPIVTEFVEFVADRYRRDWDRYQSLEAQLNEL